MKTLVAIILSLSLSATAQVQFGPLLVGTNLFGGGGVSSWDELTDIPLVIQRAAGSGIATDQFWYHDGVGLTNISSVGTGAVMRVGADASSLTNIPLSAIQEQSQGLLGVANSPGQVSIINPGSSATIASDGIDGGVLSFSIITNNLFLLDRPTNAVQHIEAASINVPVFTSDNFIVSDTLSVSNAITVGGTNVIEEIFRLFRFPTALGTHAGSATNYVVDMEAGAHRIITLTDNFNLLHVTNSATIVREVELVLTASGGNRIVSIPSWFHRNAPSFISGTTVVTNGQRASLVVATTDTSNTNGMVGYVNWYKP